MVRIWLVGLGISSLWTFPIRVSVAPSVHAKCVVHQCYWWCHQNGIGGSVTSQDGKAYGYQQLSINPLGVSANTGRGVRIEPHSWISAVYRY
ncbi:hypothetical protein MYCO108962_00375 [Mycobacterium colombiense]